VITWKKEIFMASDLERGLNRFPASPLSCDSSQPNPTLYEAILDKQFHLLVSIDIQGQNIRITAQDETKAQVGVVEAKTDMCNGANPLLRRVECPVGQPGVGYALLLELHQYTEKKGGTVSYSGIDDSTRQWITNSGLTNLLKAPVNPNI
jgi:hypothetical protein